MSYPGWRRTAGFAVLLLWLAVADAGIRLDWGACPEQQGTAISAARMQCAWLATGERLGDKPVRLRVAILRARPGVDDPHPVVYVPGGPGSNAGLDAASLRGWRSWQQRAGWHHDIVLFDPRATGESRPRPSCSNIRDQRTAAAAQTPESRAEFDNEADAAAVCYRSLGAQRAAQLGPDAQLRDLGHLIDALAVPSVQLWGVSYGTRLARVFTARHPERVQALVLDSMFPFGRDDLLAMPAQIGGAIAQLDTACQSPGIECGPSSIWPGERVAQLLTGYAQAPPHIIMHDPDGRERVFAVTPYRLLLMILFSSYDAGNAADTIARLRQASQASQGDAQALAPLASRLWRRLLSDARNEAVAWSTRCAFGDGVPDLAAWRAALSAYPAIAPYLAPARGAPICDRWKVPHVGAPSAEASLDVPTLVLAGTADPLTPGAWAERFMRLHRKARLVRVADWAHAVTFTNACAQRAVAGFLDAPAVPVPSCGTDHAHRGR